MGLFPYGGGFTVDGVGSDTWRMYYKDWAISIIPGLRANLVSVPGRTGKHNAGVEVDSRIVRLTLSCYNPSRTGLWSNLMAFAAAIDPRSGDHKLCLVDDNPNYFINCVPNSEVPASPALVTANFEVQFEASDPHWYYNAARSYNWAASNSNPLSVDNTHGNQPTPPTFTIAHPGGAGSLTGIVLTYGGSTFTYNGVLVSGDTLVVDTNNYNVTKNGASDIAHWGGDDFPLISVGAAQSITWHDTNAVGANVTVAYNERSL